MPIYFEDLETGDTYEAGSYTVTKDEIVSFAEQFDPQPFHVDEEAAKESIFGGLVASGLHTLSLSGKLFITEFVRRENVANMGGLGVDDLRWHEPVRPGDTLGLHIEVVETRLSESRSDRGYVDFERSIVIDSTEVMSFISHNIVGSQTGGE